MKSSPRAQSSSVFVWAMLSGIAVALTGFLARIAGSLYPQQYEQIPSGLFFVPLGFILGCVGAAAVRLLFPRWSSTRMFAAILLGAVGYGCSMFAYARSRTIPARLTLTFEPDPAIAVACDPRTCPAADPPLEWTVQGHLRLRETAGLGGRVNAITLESHEQLPRRPGTTSLQETRELNRFSGPKVRLTGRDLAVDRVRPQEWASYPIRYSYRTRSGTAERSVSAYVEFTDAVGHSSVFVGKWNVR